MPKQPRPARAKPTQPVKPAPRKARPKPARQPDAEAAGVDGSANPRPQPNAKWNNAGKEALIEHNSIVRDAAQPLGPLGMLPATIPVHALRILVDVAWMAWNLNILDQDIEADVGDAQMAGVQAVRSAVRPAEPKPADTAAPAPLSHEELILLDGVFAAIAGIPGIGDRVAAFLYGQGVTRAAFNVALLHDRVLEHERWQSNLPKQRETT